MRLTGLVHPPGDRLRHHVAWREVAELVDSRHDPVALEVDQERTFAANRLRDQRLLAVGLRAEVHHGRVELHELQVAQGGAGPERQRHPVARRDSRVGRLREDLTESAGRQDHRATVDRTDAVALALAHHVESDARDAAIVGQQQVDGQRVLDHLDLGGRRHRGREGTLDLGARRVPAGVHDPVAEMPALTGQRDHAVGVVVEVGADGDQLANGVGALVDQDAYGVQVAGAGTRHQACRSRAARGCPQARARRRCRPAPTAWNPRTARPWSPRGSCRPVPGAAAPPSDRRCQSR